MVREAVAVLSALLVLLAAPGRGGGFDAFPLSLSRNRFGASSVVLDAMFEVVGTWPCTRLMHVNGTAGCGSASSEADANGGALVYFASPSEIDDFAKAVPGTLSRVSPVIEDRDLSAATLGKLIALHGAIPVDNVMVVVPSVSPTVLPPSPEEAGPFLPSGDGLLAQSAPFMMSRVRSLRDSDELRARAAANKAAGYGSGSPKWQHSSRHNFYMGREGVTSEECFAKSKCSPLGGLSVWASVGQAVSAKKRTVVLAAALDGTAWFHDLAAARSSGASGVAAALLAARALGQIDSAATLRALEAQVVVALFQGEQYYRIGSRRFVRDIGTGRGCVRLTAATSYANKSCDEPRVYARAWENLTLPSISDVLVLDQVLSTNGSYYAHNAGRGNRVLEALASFASVLGASGAGVPPSSADSFSEHANFSGSAALLTAWSARVEEVNAQHHSRFDVSDGGGEPAAVSAALGSLATATARALFVAAGGNASDAAAIASIAVSAIEAQELWGCLAENFTCPLVANALNMTLEQLAQARVSSPRAASVGPLGGGPPSLFTSTYVPFKVENNGASLLERFVRSYLATSALTASAEESQQRAYLPNSTATCVKDADCFFKAIQCSSGFTGSACVRGLCVCPYAFFHDAMSTSIGSTNTRYFVKDDADARDPLFAEPLWTSQELVLYKEAAANGTTIALLAAGLAATAATALLALRAKKRLHGSRLKLD
jgi:hypothetical protein